MTRSYWNCSSFVRDKFFFGQEFKFRIIFKSSFKFSKIISKVFFKPPYPEVKKFFLCRAKFVCRNRNEIRTKISAIVKLDQTNTHTQRAAHHDCFSGWRVRWCQGHNLVGSVWMSLKVNLRVVVALSLKIERKIGESSLIVSYFLDRHCHWGAIDNTFGTMENYLEVFRFFLRTLQRFFFLV